MSYSISSGVASEQAQVPRPKRHNRPQKTLEVPVPRSAEPSPPTPMCANAKPSTRRIVIIVPEQMTQNCFKKTLINKTGGARFARPNPVFAGPFLKQFCVICSGTIITIRLVLCSMHWAYSFLATPLLWPLFLREACAEFARHDSIIRVCFGI